MKKTNVCGDTVMLKLGSCKYMMSKTVHKNYSSLNNVWVCYSHSENSFCVYSYIHFQQMCLTTETGVDLIQLLCI